MKVGNSTVYSFSLKHPVLVLVTAFHWCCIAPSSPCWGPGWENRPRCGGPLPAAAAAMAAANRGGMSPAPGGAPCAPWPPKKAKDGGKSGRAVNRNFSISASWSRFAFALLFWNQIFTWNGKEKQSRSILNHVKFYINCGIIMPTICLVFPIARCLFTRHFRNWFCCRRQVDIHDVSGVGSAPVFSYMKLTPIIGSPRRSEAWVE